MFVRDRKRSDRIPAQSDGFTVPVAASPFVGSEIESIGPRMEMDFLQCVFSACDLVADIQNAQHRYNPYAVPRGLKISMPTFCHLPEPGNFG